MMAISRGSMTKELTGNRTKKMAMGGMAGAAGVGDLAGRARGQAISAMAQQGGMGANRPMPAPASRLPVVTQLDQVRAAGMKKGGKVDKMAKGGYTRGDGACIKGHTKGTVR